MSTLEVALHTVGAAARNTEGVAPTVLIVDDHAAFRRRTRQLLEAEGLHVVGEAGTGETGVEMARAESPDVVVLDVHLPDALGFDIAEGFEPATVILVSTHDEPSYRDRALEAGAAGFLSKDELDRAAIEALSD